MATTTTKKTTTKATAGAAKKAPAAAKNTKPAVEPVVTAEVKPEPKPAKKVYGQTDPIPCKSIVAGELGMLGIKSKINYNWAERNDITEVEYQDVVAAIRQNASFIVKPYFIIMDEELVNQFPQVKKIYDSMYSGADLKEILRMNPEQMKETILSLPDGAQESIKNIAATQIRAGRLDSVRKIKILDEIFGTELLLLTELFK